MEPVEQVLVGLLLHGGLVSWYGDTAWVAALGRAEVKRLIHWSKSQGRRRQGLIPLSATLLRPTSNDVGVAKGAGWESPIGASTSQCCPKVDSGCGPIVFMLGVNLGS